jgi:tRNA (guanine-N7-)-methyltransferase
LTAPIRSYVLRQSRTTSAQRRALTELFPKYGIEFAERSIEPQAIFGRSAPLVVEIGSGMGETTIEIARAQPATDFIAIEVHGPGVGSLLKTIEAERITNLRVIRHDAVEVLERMIGDGSLAGIHLFFPDPWPKKRHHKRRLLQAPFVHDLAMRLAPGGYLHVATDWAPYADEILAVMAAEPLLANTSDGFAPRPVWRPLTKFEQRGIARGHAVFDMLFTKRPA